MTPEPSTDGGRAAAPREPWRFCAHARRLGMPNEVAKCVLADIKDGAAVPEVLRRAALMAPGLDLNPNGLAAQVHRLLAWDYRSHPEDYAGDPKDESVLVHPEGEPAAGRGAWPDLRTDGGAPPGAARAYLDMHARRAWAADPSQYGYALPSYGTSYDRCGQYAVQGCLCDGRRHSKRTRWRCGRLSCPECYENSIKLAAVRSTKRLAAGAILRNSAVAQRCRLFIYHHLAVSVAPHHYHMLQTPEGVDRYRRKVFEQLKWLGYWGGAIVFHTWRFEGDRRYFEPHFHVIAAGYVDREKYLKRYGRRIMLGEMDDDPVSEVNRRTGDIYAKVSHMDSTGEICGVLAYLLTHVGLRIPDGGRRNYGQAVTYFGDVAPNKLSAKTVLAQSREAGLEIANIAQAWTKRAAARRLSASVSIQPVTCPPRDGARGSVFDSDPRTAEYGIIRSMPAAEAGPYMQSLVAGRANAPSSEMDQIGGADGPAPEPYRYMAVSVNYDNYEGVRVRSAHAVVALDPSTEGLCRQCRGALRPIVRVDGGGIRPPDGDLPDGVQRTHDDAEDWVPYLPRGEHAGMGVPYYRLDGSPRWDTGVPNMPKDARRMPAEYRGRLREDVDYRTIRYVVAAMRRQDPSVNPVKAKSAARRHLARAGRPDKMRDGWEDDLLAGVRREYEAPAPTAPQGQDTLD